MSGPGYEAIQSRTRIIRCAYLKGSLPMAHQGSFVRLQSGFFFALATTFISECGFGVSSRFLQRPLKSRAFHRVQFAMQPLSRVKRIQQSRWGDHQAMIVRPLLATKVAQCVAEWAEIENHLGLLLALLLHANEKAALSMFSSVENRAAQLRMLHAAAESSLTPHHFDVLESLITACVRPVMKERDKLAHWCWGYSDELPDALLLTEPSNKLRGMLQVSHIQANTGSSNSTIAFESEKILVIRSGDLDRLYEKSTRVQTLLRMAMGSVWTANTAQGRDANLQQLSSEPEIQEALTRRREARQKT